MKSFLSLCFCLFILVDFAYPVTIKGRITNETGEALGFATILEKGTTNGTSANGDGYYTLSVTSGTKEISCQFVGYQTINKQVDVTTQELIVDFQLLPQTLKINEVVIRADGEDPAYPIMRQVIARRKYHANLIKTFETDVYLKGVMRLRSTPKSIMGFKLDEKQYKEMNEAVALDSLGKGVIYLLEEYSRYAYKSPGKYNTKVISLRESGDPKGLGWATMPAVINVYDNNIQVLEGINERGFISPANSNAFLYYKYKFLGSFMNDGRMINKIQVIPKRKFEPLFRGYVYVVDEEWVFQSVDLTLTQEAQMKLLDTLKLEQYYVPLAKDVWVIQNQVIYPALKIMGFDIVGNVATSYKHQKVNEPIPDHLFAGNIISSYDSAAHDRSSGYWDTLRPVPLEVDEIKDFKVKDSLYLVNRNKKDSLAIIPSFQLKPGSFLLSGASIRLGNNSWSMKPLISSFAYNTVEGVNATLDISWKHKSGENKVLDLGLKNRYGFSNTHYNVLLDLKYELHNPTWKGRFWKFSLQTGQYVFQLNDNNPVTPFINEWYTLLGGLNYMKIYENRLAKLKVQRNWGNGFNTSAGLSYEHRMPLVNTTDYTFNDSKRDKITSNQPENFPVFEEHKAFVVNATLSYQPGWKYIKYPEYKMPVASKAPVFTLRYTKGIASVLESKSDFDKWSAEVQGQLRLRMPGTLQYRLISGGFLNKKEVGIPDWMHLFGNQTFLANPYLNSFQLAPYYRFSNTADLYLQAHAEWHLDGWLTNKIPGFRRLNWYLVGGANALYIDNNNYYTEVFVGLENIGFKIARFGRVDFVAGYESGKAKPSFGVRVGFGEVLWQLLGINAGKAGQL